MSKETEIYELVWRRAIKEYPQIIVEYGEVMPPLFGIGVCMAMILTRENDENIGNNLMRKEKEENDG